MVSGERSFVTLLFFREALAYISGTSINLWSSFIKTAIIHSEIDIAASNFQRFRSP